MGTRSSSLGVKQLGREADHSPPSSAEVKNELSYTSTPQYAFMGWCSVKAQGQLYLYCLSISIITTMLMLKEYTYEGVSKSFRTGPRERKLQMVQLSATKCSCLVSFAAISLCVASQRVITKACVCLIIDSGRKLLDTPSYSFVLGFFLPG
jgi:hypothetical protein